MSAKEGIPFYHLNAIPPTPIPNRPCKDCVYYVKGINGIWCNSVAKCVDWKEFKAKVVEASEVKE